VRALIHFTGSANMAIKITLEHTIEEINTILLALSKRPFEEVAELIAKIRGEGEKQVSSQAPAQNANVETLPPSEANPTGA